MPDLHSVNWWLIGAVIFAGLTWWRYKHEFMVNGTAVQRSRTRNRHRAWTVLVAVLAGICLVIGVPQEARAGHGGAHCTAIVHRALTAEGTENQPAGVTQAEPWGYVEADATIIESGEVMAIHDGRLDRLTGGATNEWSDSVTLTELRSYPHPFGYFRETTALIARAAALDVPIMVTFNLWARQSVAERNSALDQLYEASRLHPRPKVVYFGGYGAQDDMRARHPDASTFWRYDADDTRTYIRENAASEDVDLVALPEAHYAAGLVSDLKAMGAKVATRQVLTAAKARAAQEVGIVNIQGNDPVQITTRWCQ